MGRRSDPPSQTMHIYTGLHALAWLRDPLLHYKENSQNHICLSTLSTAREKERGKKGEERERHRSEERGESRRQITAGCVPPPAQSGCLQSPSKFSCKIGKKGNQLNVKYLPVLPPRQGNYFELYQMICSNYNKKNMRSQFTSPPIYQSIHPSFF